MRCNSLLPGSDVLLEKVARALEGVRGRMRIVLEVAAVEVHTPLPHDLDVERVVGIGIDGQGHLEARAGVVGLQRAGEARPGRCRPGRLSVRAGACPAPKAGVRRGRRRRRP